MLRRILILGAALLALSSPAKAADSTVTLMTAASALGGTELFYVVQGAADRKGTPAQVATYVYSLMSGDCTVAASVITCAKINGNTFPASGTSGGIPYWSGTNAISSSAALTANLPVIGGGAGVAPSVGTRSGNTTAFVTTTGTQTSGNCVSIDASGNHIASGAGCGPAAPVTSVTPGPGLVSGVTASCTQTAITTTGTLAVAGCVNAQVGTTYTVLDGDRGKLVTFTNAASIAVTLPQAGTGSAFANGWVVDVLNRGAGTVTITPTTSTINGTTTLVLTTGQGARIFSDGTNYQVQAGSGSGGSGISSLTPGPGLVSGVTASCTQTAITTSGTLSEASCLNAQTGTTYTVLDSDRGKLVTLTNAAAIAVTLPQAGTASAFANGWKGTFLNKGPTTATFTPTTSTINGAASYLLFAGQSVKIVSDGTNYQIDPGTTGGVTVSVQSGANYAIVPSDFGRLLYLSNASNQIPTLPTAASVGANWFVQACNDNTGTQTVTPTTSTIGGAATYVLPAGSAASPNCVAVVSDGTNYKVVPDFFRVGANVATAAANALSAAGGLTTTIASGTSALGTSAIGSAACATVVTTAATNTATTDVVLASFNGDPTAVTGYIPATAGMLTIISYPTANNVNFKVCNNTSSSITPGAITLNWRVVR